MHHAAAHVVGASVEACRQVWSGESLHSANITGGLHHAMRDRAAGFCIYNDVAVGIQYLLDQGAERVAYVDIDVHHGDGVEKIFWNDPRVLTISLHETGQMLFPGTGFPNDTGGPDALGSAVNVALPPGTADAGWLRAFHAVVPPLLREFRPEVLVTQHGCDSHIEDPLAHLMLTVDGQRAAYLALHDLAHEVCDGRWVVTGGGGYALVEVVPRAWTHLLAIVGGHPLDPATETPEGWRAYVAEMLGRTAPFRLTDGRNPAYRDWVGGLRPRDLAGPRDPRHADRDLPLARARSAALKYPKMVKIKRTRRRPSSSSSQSLPHESHQALFSPNATRAITGGEAGGAWQRKSVHDGYQLVRGHLRIEVPDRCRGGRDDARLQDDRLPLGPQRRAARRAGGPLVPRRREGRGRVPPQELLQRRADRARRLNRTHMVDFAGLGFCLRASAG